MEKICYFLRALLVIKEPTLKENRSYKYKKIVYLTLEFCRKSWIATKMASDFFPLRILKSKKTNVADVLP
jgi:hypothetical protein